MFVICDIHGGVGGGVRASPDLLTAPRQAAEHAGRSRSNQDVDIVQVIYEFEGSITNVFTLSREFAEMRGIAPGVYELPDDYPDWLGELGVNCYLCFIEYWNGTFIDGVWHPE